MKVLYLFTVSMLSLSLDSSAQCVNPYGQDPTKFTLTFQDEFNGTALDASKWTDHIWYDSPSSTNDYGVSGGSLKIWPQRNSSGQFVERILVTDKKHYQTYGYFEIEAKLPVGAGVWPAFWLLNSDNPPNEPEIDIMEAYSGDKTGYWADANKHPIRYSATYYQDGNGSGGPEGSFAPSTGDLSAGFHKYAVKWEATKLSFYFDGQLVYSPAATMSKKMYILLDIQYGSASGPPDNTTPTGSTNSFEINYVRAWSLSGPGCTTTSPTPNATFCTVAQSPLIDGIAENIWTNIKSDTLKNTQQLAGTISSAVDLSANYKASWDNTALYLLVNVKDDTLKNDSGTDTWEDDAIEVFIDGNNDKTTTYDANDHQYIFRINDATVYEYKNAAAQPVNPALVTFSQGSYSGGYLMEIKIAWSALGVTAANGKLVGLDIHVDDDDDGGSGDAKVMWFTQAGHTPSTDPSLFGTNKLDNTSCGGVTTEFVKEENKNFISVYPNPFNTNFTLKFTSSIIIKDAVMKIYDVCGKEVRAVSITSHEMSIGGDELKNGLYFYTLFNNDIGIANGKLIVR